MCSHCILITGAFLFAGSAVSLLVTREILIMSMVELSSAAEAADIEVETR